MYEHECNSQPACKLVISFVKNQSCVMYVYVICMICFLRKVVESFAKRFDNLFMQV